MSDLLTKADVIEMLRAECRKAGSQAAWAAVAGISDQWVSDALAGRRPVGLKIATALGLERADRWQRFTR